jgi:hypothetical protein
MPPAINSVTSSLQNEGVQRTGTADVRAFEQSLARLGVRSVEPQRTRLTPDQASTAIREALSRTTGTAPNEQTVALFTAQWAHETAHGASMYNYNFGGIKGTGPTGLSVQQRTREGSGTNERQVTDRFRAYESAEDGANDYVKLLTQRYPEAVSAAQRGDASGFVRGLKQRGYFTGDEHAYERSVTSISAGLLNGNYSVRAAPHRLPDPLEVVASKQASALVGETQYDAAAPKLSGHPNFQVGPLMPTALASALSGPRESNSDPHETFMSDELSTVSALSMADEVVRAALLDPQKTNHGSSRPGASPRVG